MTTIIIGGGLAGLTAGHALSKQGEQVTVLEARQWPGGLINPATFEGVTVDAGAEAFAARDSQPVRDLLDELGMDSQGPSGRSHIWWPEGAFPLADGVLGIPGSSEDPAWDSLSEEGRARAMEDLTMGPEVGADASTVGELVVARMGEETLERLVLPLTMGVFRALPHDMQLSQMAPLLLPGLATEGSLMAAVAKARSGSPSIEQPTGGMFRLIEKLAEQITTRGGGIVGDAAVVAVAQEEAGYKVWTSREELTADKLVIACPGDTASQFLDDLGIEAEPAAAPITRLAMVAFRDERIAAAPVGSGLLVGRPDPDIVARAMTHYTHKWPWSANGDIEILRLSYGDVQPTPEQAVKDASGFLRIDLSEDSLVGFAPRTYPMAQRLAPEVQQRILDDVAKLEGLNVVGAWIDGNGISSIVRGAERVIA